MKVLLWGAGAHGRVIHDLADACGYSDIAFVDDQASAERVCGCRVLMPDDHRIGDYRHFIVSVGDNQLRARCFEAGLQRGLEPAVLIHPSAVISRSAILGRGTMVLPLVVVGSGVAVGENCVLNTACVVEHDSRVSNHVHISPGAIIGGEVTVEAFAHVGMGARVLSRLGVGSGSVLGAGAVAVKDVAAGWIVTGIPAQPRREIGRGIGQ
jgi:sugar O-acyltransferase (sialic acid O-acetyltransferase NeuD family)